MNISQVSIFSGVRESETPCFILRTPGTAPGKSQCGAFNRTVIGRAELWVCDDTNVIDLHR